MGYGLRPNPTYVHCVYVPSPFSRRPHADWGEETVAFVVARAGAEVAAADLDRLCLGTDMIDITAVNSDVFSLNHDIYANSPAVIGDLRRLLEEGQRPPDARTPELVKVPVKGGVCWRYKAP